MTEYISNEDFRKQKAALTRAQNSGDPRKVVAACVKVVADWHGKCWPDDWHRWNIALSDARFKLERMGEDVYDIPYNLDDV